MSEEGTVTLPIEEYRSLYSIALSVAIAHPLRGSLNLLDGVKFTTTVCDSLGSHRIVVVPEEHFGTILVALNEANNGK